MPQCTVKLVKIGSPFQTGVAHGCIPTHDTQNSETSLSNKSLSAALGVTKFKAAGDRILVTLCRAT
jgi:hypothetical protein